MSQIAKSLFDGIAAIKGAVQTVAPGLKDIGSDVKAEMSRQGTQGAMELASALFNGQAFVPYGPGQYTPDATPSQAEIAPTDQQPAQPGVESPQ